VKVAVKVGDIVGESVIKISGLIVGINAGDVDVIAGAVTDIVEVAVTIEGDCLVSGTLVGTAVNCVGSDTCVAVRGAGIVNSSDMLSSDLSGVWAGTAVGDEKSSV